MKFLRDKVKTKGNDDFWERSDGSQSVPRRKLALPSDQLLNQGWSRAGQQAQVGKGAGRQRTGPDAAAWRWGGVSEPEGRLATQVLGRGRALPYLPLATM